MKPVYIYFDIINGRNLMYDADSKNAPATVLGD